MENEINKELVEEPIEELNEEILSEDAIFGMIDDESDESENEEN